MVGSTSRPQAAPSRLEGTFLRVSPVLSRRERGRALLPIVAASLFGLLYGLTFSEGLAFGLLNGFLIGLCIALLEVFWLHRRPGQWLRRRSMLVYVGGVTLLWSMIVLVNVTLTRHWLGMDHGLTLEWLLTREVGGHFLFSLLMALLISFVMRVGAFLGGPNLVALVLGRYQQPVDEKLAFMFLDITGSTELTERLGDVTTQQLISRFFFDLSETVEQFGGDIHRFIGDQVVVTWPYSRQPDFRHLLFCLDAIYRLQDARKSSYEQEFGAAPRFHVGLHGGHVLAGEIGDQKRELAYFGDAVNVAAGLQQRCKALNAEVMISASLLEVLLLPSAFQPRPVGAVTLKDKRHAIEAVALDHEGRFSNLSAMASPAAVNPAPLPQPVC